MAEAEAELADNNADVAADANATTSTAALEEAFVKLLSADVAAQVPTDDSVDDIVRACRSSVAAGGAAEAIIETRVVGRFALVVLP